MLPNKTTPVTRSCSNISRISGLTDCFPLPGLFIGTTTTTSTSNSTSNNDGSEFFVVEQSGGDENWGNLALPAAEEDDLTNPDMDLFDNEQGIFAEASTIARSSSTITTNNTDVIMSILPSSTKQHQQSPPMIIPPLPSSSNPNTITTTTNTISTRSTASKRTRKPVITNNPTFSSGSSVSSLTSSQSDSGDSSEPPRRKRIRDASVANMTPKAKEERRKARNRELAAESRVRRKNEMEALKHENTLLRARITQLEKVLAGNNIKVPALPPVSNSTFSTFPIVTIAMVGLCFLAVSPTGGDEVNGMNNGGYSLTASVLVAVLDAFYRAYHMLIVQDGTFSLLSFAVAIFGGWLIMLVIASVNATTMLKQNAKTYVGTTPSNFMSSGFSEVKRALRSW
jgi:hypothetical protein